MTQRETSDAKQVEPLTALVRRPPWSLLRVDWLDVPIGVHVGQANLTWGAFSELFEGFLHDVFQHVGRRVLDRSCLEGIVTAVLVENLDVLVSPLGRREKLARLITAADLCITQSEKTSDRAGD